MDRDLPVDGEEAQAFKLREEYGPEVLNRFAIDFIDRHKNRRFFLYYPMKLPHSPVLPTPDSKLTPEIERLIETARDIPVEDHGYSLKGDRRWQDDVVAYIDKMVGRLSPNLTKRASSTTH